MIERSRKYGNTSGLYPSTSVVEELLFNAFIKQNHQMYEKTTTASMLSVRREPYENLKLPNFHGISPRLLRLFA
jgi:hypothetical protein